MFKNPKGYIIVYHLVNLFLAAISVHLLSITFNYVLAPFLYLIIGLFYVLTEFLKAFIQSYIYDNRINIMLVLLYFVLCLTSFSTNYLGIDRIYNYQTKVHNQLVHKESVKNRIKNDSLYIALQTEVAKEKSEKAVKNLNTDFHLEVEKNNSNLKSFSKKPYQLSMERVRFILILFEIISIVLYFKLSCFSITKSS